MGHLVEMQQSLILFASILAVRSVTIGAIVAENGMEYTLKSTPSLDWWETAVLYHIFTRSFQDSDGDGIGDLRGVIQRLYHLKDAGITSAWLSPIFKSPQADQGYDISDYFDIEPDYGTVADLKELLEKAKELNIKLILDIVPNHTSDEHEWFKKSAAEEKGYEDFYIWHDGKVVDHIRQPPNNWISNFKGSAWTWNEERQQYFYHNFAPQQPDLNYSNPLVVEAMKNVLRYWLDFGVDGFRVDAMPYIFEDPEFRDEPLASGYTEYDINDFDCLDHVYTKDLAENVDIVYQFRAVIDDYNKNNGGPTKIMMTEAYSSIETLRLYYSTADGVTSGVHFSFNFDLVTKLRSKDFNVERIFETIFHWMDIIPHQFTSSWVLSNHDNHRVATRVGRENVDGFNMLIAFLPGVMVTYYGEEIGMEDGEVACEQGYDPRAIKNCSTFAEVSRDGARTPFHWDNSENAGFTTGTPWLPISDKATEVNLVAQNVPGLKSHYNVYKQLINFRKSFQRSSRFNNFVISKVSEHILKFDRVIDSDEYCFLFNIGNTEESVDFYSVNRTYTVLVASVNSSYTTGDIVEVLILKPHDSVIMQRNENLHKNMSKLGITVVYT